MADIRSPAVAGMFYPAQPDVLRAEIIGYLEAADPPALTSVRAVIVPHAGYMYSGPVAAYAYRLLADQPKAPARILILGPSHRSWFPGVAAADVDGFRTPLGIQPVDRAYVRKLAQSSSLFSAINTPHIAEHCLEVQYPFIQVIWPEVPTVPLLFGQVDPLAVAADLNAHLSANDLIVVSSDLSHYHTNEIAHKLDRELLNALVRGDKSTVAQKEACGMAPILTLMTLAESGGWQPHLLDYRTSGDITGDTRQVVGYAAVAYTQEAR